MYWLDSEARSLLEKSAITIHGINHLAELEDFSIHQLPAILGGDFASWNEHDASLRLTRVATSRSHESRVAPFVPALNKTLPSHPLFGQYIDFSSGRVCYVDTVGRTRAMIDDAAFKRSAFYREVAGPLGIEDQIVMHIYIYDGQGVILTVHGSRLFSEQSLGIAAFLRSHLVGRYHAILNTAEKIRSERRAVIGQLDTRISKRESEVLRLICRGQSNDQIAFDLGISSRTAENHVASILRKLGAETRFQLAARYGAWLEAEA